MSARSPETKRRRAKAPRADQPDATMGASSSRRVTPLSVSALTQAFLAHEDQLSIIQAQTTIVFKLPAEGSISRALFGSGTGLAARPPSWASSPTWIVQPSRLHRPPSQASQVLGSHGAAARQLSKLLGDGCGAGQPKGSISLAGGDLSLLCAGKCEEDPRHPGPPPCAAWLHCQARRHNHQASREL